MTLDESALVSMIASVEVNVGIAFACMHAMKPIMANLFPSIFGSAADSHAIQRMPSQVIDNTNSSSNGDVCVVFGAKAASKDFD
jgi:hypothetical protein